MTTSPATEYILIADDHAIIRHGIRIILEKHRKNAAFIEAATCAEVRKAFDTQQISYAILDLSYADGNLFSIIEEIEQFSAHTEILIYSMNSERIYARRLMEKGAKGYVSKQADIKELEIAIETLLRGEIYLSAALREMLFSTIRSKVSGNPFDQLSNRELKVVEFLAEGMGTKEIAGQMNLDITTISTYRRRAFEKLVVENIIELREKLTIYR